MGALRIEQDATGEEKEKKKPTYILERRKIAEKVERCREKGKRSHLLYARSPLLLAPYARSLLFVALRAKRIS